LTKKDEIKFLITYKNRDSVKLIYNFMRINKLTDLSDSSFYKKYFVSSDIDRCLNLLDQIEIKQKELRAATTKKSETENKILTNEEIKTNSIWFLAILFLLAYFLRPLIKILKWSFQTLRD